METEDNLLKNIPQEGFVKHWNEFMADMMLTFDEYRDVIFPSVIKPEDAETVDKTICFFHDQFGPHKELITSKDEALFSKGLKLSSSLSLHVCWEEGLSDVTKAAIWKYLQTLVFFSSLYVDSKVPGFNDVLKEMIEEMAAMNTDLSGNKVHKNRRAAKRSKKMEKRVRDLQNLIETFSKISAEGTEGAEGAEGSEGAGGMFDMSGFKLPPNLPNIFNGTIGKLAMEIASEINVEDLGISSDTNPIEMIKKIMMTDPGSKSGIPSIVEKLTEKIRKKMSEKGISEKDLASEAKKMIEELQSSGMSMDKIMELFKSLGLGGNMFMPKGAKMAFNTSHNSNMARMKAQATLEKRRAAAAAASAATESGGASAGAAAEAPKRAVEAPKRAMEAPKKPVDPERSVRPEKKP